MQIVSQLEIEHTEQAMRIVQGWIPTILEHSPEHIKAKFDNAMLNVVVNRMVEVEGEEVTAAILWRLADAISSGSAPTSDNPLDLSRLDS